MIRRSLMRRLEHLESRLTPADEPLVIQVKYASPDGSEEDGPRFTIPSGGRQTGALGLPAEGGPALLVGSIATACTHEADRPKAAKAGAEISTSGASPLGPIGRRAGDISRRACFRMAGLLGVGRFASRRRL